MNKGFKARTCYLYVFLSLLVIVFETFWILKGEWGGDFWEHSAVVNELSRNFLHPRHPMLDLDVPHVFYSPYTLAVALLSKISGLNSIDSLAVFAVTNLFFFLFSLQFFCKRLFKSNSYLIASLSLLFILFFWGRSPFLWSGFYHVFDLHAILPYPSTFAMCLSFLALGILADTKPGLNPGTLLIISLTSVAFLTHPYTGVFLAIALTGMVFTFYRKTFKESLFCFFSIAGPVFLLCCLWPYYNFVLLMFGDNPEFHEISKGLYSRVLGVNWPALFILPFLLLIKRTKEYDFLFVSLLLMVLLYIFGFVFGLYGVSRIIAGIMLLSQITLAVLLVKIFAGTPLKWQRLYAGCVVLLFCVSVIRNFEGLKEVFNFSKKSNTLYYKRYEFLRSMVPANSLILSDNLSNWYIAGFGPKVIASAHPLFLVRDNKERQKAVADFFGKDTNGETRKEIIQKYHPEYILVDLNLKNSSGTEFSSNGKVIYKKDGLQLLEVYYPVKEQ